jgi:hypothetical protein
MARTMVVTIPVMTMAMMPVTMVMVTVVVVTVVMPPTPVVAAPAMIAAVGLRNATEQSGCRNGHHLPGSFFADVHSCLLKLRETMTT